MNQCNQRGFSALPMFLAVLGLIVLMGMSNFFVVPKSENTDKTLYKAKTVITPSDKSSLHLIELGMETPTPTPTPTVIPTIQVPIETQGPTSIPPTAGPTAIPPTPGPPTIPPTAAPPPPPPTDKPQ